LTPRSKAKAEDGDAETEATEDALDDNAKIGDTRKIAETEPEELNKGCQYFGDVVFHKSDDHPGKWEPHGEGTQIYPCKSLYQGTWVDGIRLGKGAMIWSNGRKFLGDWKEDAPNGLGVQHWPEGKTFDGGWKNGEPDGYGYFVNNTGIRRNGLWKDGSRVKWIGIVFEERHDDVIDNQFTNPQPEAAEESKEEAKE